MELFKIFGTIALNGQKEVEEGLDNASDKASNFSKKITDGITTLAKWSAAATVAAAGVATSLVKSAVTAYADYEQLVGGVETLYGTAFQTIEEYAASVGKSADEVGDQFEMMMNRQDTVMKNAANAYKTAGLSVNEYMETVNGFAASLTSSLGEYEWEAAGYADMIITDMADNANKMGTSMESIQNAYAGFAKQNYTMLDNLKLGYGGTKSEMERLMRDAEKYAGYIEGSLNIDSFADVAEAINIVQTELGITGTTAKEAAETISGSLAMVKSAWKNLVVGMADDTQDFDKLINNFVESVSTAGKNILPRVEIAIKGVAKLVNKLMPVIAETIPKLVRDILPDMLNAGMELLTSLIEGIVSSIPELIPCFQNIIDQLLLVIIDNLPTIILAAISIIAAIGQGIIDSLPQIIDAGTKLIQKLASGMSNASSNATSNMIAIIRKIVDSIVANLPLLVQSGIEIITSLTMGLIDAIPQLLEQLPILVEQISTVILEQLPVIISAGTDLLIALVDNLPVIIDTIVAVIPQIIDGILNALLEEGNLQKIIQAGVDLFIALVKNIDDIIEEILYAVASILSALFDKFTSSDTLEEMKDAGIDMVYSFLEGLQSVWGEVTGWVNDALSNLFGFGNKNLVEVTRTSAGSRSIVGSGKSRVGKYATGGVVPKGQIAFMEGDGAEAVVPLDQNQKWISKVAQDMNTALSNSGSNEAFARLESKFDTLINVMQGFKDMQVRLDSGALVGELTSEIDESLGEIDNIRKRGG